MESSAFSFSIRTRVAGKLRTADDRHERLERLVVVRRNKGMPVLAADVGVGKDRGVEVSGPLTLLPSGVHPRDVVVYELYQAFRAVDVHELPLPRLCPEMEGRQHPQRP